MPTDLATLQYPRHLHQSDTFRIVADAVEAAQAMAEGWTVSPHAPLAPASTPEPDPPPPDSPPVRESEPAAAPVALRKKPGRPRKL